MVITNFYVIFLTEMKKFEFRLPKVENQISFLEPKSSFRILFNIPIFNCECTRVFDFHLEKGKKKAAKKTTKKTSKK